MQQSFLTPSIPRRIISASRRTDIPAFYGHWFVNRCRVGFCEVMNPFGGQISRISLDPAQCLAIFFWTRNPAPFLPIFHPGITERYAAFFSITLLNYPAVLEPHQHSQTEVLHAFRRLSTILSPGHLIWRYDPIILSSLTPQKFHLQSFKAIAASLEGLSRRCIISFLDSYAKTKRRLESVSSLAGIRFHNPGEAEKLDLACELKDIAAQHGMVLSACCETGLTRDGAIAQAHCIGRDILIEMGVIQPGTATPARPTRPGCGCIQSVDIGAYDSCLSGCEYCYATRSQSAALARWKRHDPANPMLIPVKS